MSGANALAVRSAVCKGAFVTDGNLLRRLSGKKRPGIKRKEESMEAKELIDFLGKAEKLKSVPRHCVTSDGVVENVAAHSWRLALMAFLLKGWAGEINIDRVIRMYLVHDLGEAVTGDIPTFEKAGEHEGNRKAGGGRTAPGAAGAFVSGAACNV